MSLPIRSRRYSSLLRSSLATVLRGTPAANWPPKACCPPESTGRLSRSRYAAASHLLLSLPARVAKYSPLPMSPAIKSSSRAPLWNALTQFVTSVDDAGRWRYFWKALATRLPRYSSLLVRRLLRTWREDASAEDRDCTKLLKPAVSAMRLSRSLYRLFTKPESVPPETVW